MADTYNEYDGTGSQDTFDYDFPYLKTTDVKVSVDGVLKELTTDYTRPTVTRIQFNSDKKPANGTKVRIYRDTDEATVNATFYPGSAIKSSDLNDNFLQAIYIGEEGKENADDAWNKLEDSIDSTETWVSDNTKIGTTGAIDARINTELTSGSKNFNTSGTLAAGATTVTGNITVSGTVDGRDVAADGTKLDGIESGATADQTNAEIRAAVEAASDSNVFTDADHSKLNAIEASATADQTAAEIKTAYESNSDTNAFTDADHTKLDGIEASATADQTASEIRTLVGSASDSNVFTDADHTKLDGIESGATADQTAADIKGLLNASQLTNNQLATNCVATANIQNGNVTNAKIATDAISTDRIVDANITTAKIANDAVTEAKLSISNAGSNGQFLQKQSGNTGGLTWATVSGGGGSVGGDTGIDFNDGVKVRFGTNPSDDFEIYHNGNTYLTNNSEGNALYIQTYGENAIKCNPNGAVELYYNGVKTLATESTGITILGAEAGDASIHIYSDEGDDDADKIRLRKPAASNLLTIEGHNGTAWEDIGRFNVGGGAELYYDGVKHFETHPLGIKVIGVGAGTAQIDIQPDQGDNNADKWKVGATDNGHFFISNKDSGAWDTNIECNRSGNVELYYDGLKTFETQAHGVTVTDDDTSVQINMVNSSGTAGYLYGNGTTDFGLLDGQGHYTIKGIKDGAVELYYDGVKTLATESTGITILGAEGGDASIHIYSDEGDDNADKIRIRKPAASNLLTIEGHNGTAWEDIGRFNVGGGAELYYDGVKKLETATDKINFHAHAKVNADNTYDLGASGARWKDVFISNDIDIIDDGKILLGTADDLQIYHSSNDNSYIQNATGQLRIKGNAIRLRGYTEDDMMISTDLDGAVALAYDGVQRFETTANGAKVTGKLLVDGAVEYDAFSSSSIHVDGYICMGRTDTTVAQDNSIAGFRFYSNDTNINSGNFLNVATIDINADGDFLSGDAPTNMVFKTMKDGTTTLTEAFRLDSNQNATFAGSLDIAGAIDENAFTITDASSVALDPDNGTIQIWNLTANRTATDSFTAGQSMLLMISDGTSNTITWPTMTWVGGSAPTLATSGATCIELWKVGSTLYGSHVGDVA